MKNSDLILNRIIEKKRLFDSLKPISPALIKNLYEWHRIALTYTSNAIEGNTLTHQETAMVVHEGIMVGGKTLNEHLEAINHAKAVDLIMQLATTKTKRSNFILDDLLAIHNCILQKIDDANAGIFRNMLVRIVGSMVTRPNYVKVPVLMDELIQWLQKSDDHCAKIAAELHLRFVFIHPFVDGNGRTARLLMNLVLLQEGYPLVIIEKERRKEYLDAIEEALLKQNHEAFYCLVFEAIEESLDRYIHDVQASV